ncbi:MAG: hypothetical protein WKF89_01255 [Chitinophagaceae bacterium]
MMLYFVAILATTEINLQEYHLLFHLFPIRRETRSFHPHVSTANLLKEEFVKAWPLFKHQQFLASFAAPAITLLHHTGSSWQVVTTAPLPQVS